MYVIGGMRKLILTEFGKALAEIPCVIEVGQNFLLMLEGKPILQATVTCPENIISLSANS